MLRQTLTRSAAIVATLGVLLVAGCQQESTGAEPPPATGTPRISAQPSAPASGASGSAQPSASASSAAPTITAVNNLDAITVTGERGAEPKVAIDGPYAIDDTRTKVLVAGNGPTVQASFPVTVNYYGVNGRTGEKFDDSWSRGAPATFSLDGVVPGFRKGLEGQKVGSRVVIAMPGKDGYDASGGSPQAGIQVGDTLVFVVDIEATVLEAPQGQAVAPVGGLPTVAGGTGTPTITVPKTDPPAELKVQPLITGTGAEVTEGAQVYVRYRGVLWSDGKIIDDNYGKAPEATVLGTTLIEGFRTGLVGQKVGSRVMLIIPPAQGYPEGNPGTPAVPQGETLVYVVDILFTQAAQQGQ